MLLVMMVSPLTQGSRQVGPDRIEQHRPDARLRQCALDLPDDVRAHCQIGRVDLEYKAGVDHSAIFMVVAMMHPPPKAPTFTPKQGQYLAFIYAYTRVLGRPPPKPTCRGASA